MTMTIKKRLGSLLGPQGRSPQLVNGTTTQVAAGERAEITLVKTGDVTYRVDARVPKGLDGDPSGVADLSAAMASDINTEGSSTQAALLEVIGESTAGSGPAREGALGVLRARLMYRDTAPVLLVFAGSSTTEGSNVAAADRWVNRLAAAHTGHPVPYKLEEATAAAPYGPGIHLANLGRSGTNAGTYLTVAEASTVGSWDPALVSHGVGANDAVLSYGSPQYVADALRARIDAIDAAAALPVGHILMHQHERSDQALNHPWGDYLVKLYALADEYPNVSVFNAAQHFYPLGVPGADPLGLMEADRIHAAEQGHALYADLWDQLLALPSYSHQVLLADSFNRPDGNLAGQRADQGTGVWTLGSGTFNVTGSKAVGGASGSTTFYDVGTQDVDITATAVYAGPSVTGLVFRSLDMNNRYGLYLEGDNEMIRLYRMVSGANSIVAGVRATGLVGTHDLEVKIRGREITATVDGATTLTYTVPEGANESTWTKVGFRGAGSDIQFDNVRVTTPVTA